MLGSHHKTIREILGRSPIHPFPARMAPGIALDAIGQSSTPLRILDPMAGSGTVLAVAREKGHRAFGVDLDPLAVLLSKVWTSTVNAAEVLAISHEVLGRARITFSKLTSGSAYPDGSDEETRKFLRFWFDNYARQQLAALHFAILEVEDKAIRDVLWCGFSRLIITKSAGASLAMDLSHSRPHKAFTYAPVKPFNKFISAVETVVANCPQAELGQVGPASVVKHGDARRLKIESESIDLVLTSPPYLNAIDYMRCSKFSLVWMGYNLDSARLIRGASVGAEKSSEDARNSEWVKAIIQGLGLTPALSSRDNALLSQYVWDMSGALSEVARVLKPGGRAVYVVGDSTVRGTFVSNSAVVEAVAISRGLSLKSSQSRELPANRRYMPPPKAGAAGMDARMRCEVVSVFSKPA
jgi:SAM-dependent methyltransferase